MKKILTVMSMALLLLCGAVGIGFGFGGATTAQAASYSSPKYKTNGSYNTGGAETGGSPSNFGIYMHAASQNGSSGTVSNDKVLNWTYVYIKIEVSAITNHVSFKLTRNGYAHTSKSLSGNANQTLYSGSLSDGEYELTYVGNYKKNWLSGTMTFTYKYRFVIDQTGPAFTLKAGGSTISSGSYTNKQVVYSVSDYKPYCIYYRRPGNSTYNVSYAESYTIPTTDANNGWWYLYAEDWYYNLNSTVSVYMDTVKPVGTVKAGGYTVSNGGYTNRAVSYSATDSGGVSYYQYKTPSSSAWQSYTGGTSVSGSYGWYTFRAVDGAGNISDEYKVYYDAVQPTGTLYGGTVGKTSGSYTNAEYVKYVASSLYSGIANCYVKIPNTGYYTSYTSGSQLTAEGTYSFYCVSKAGTTSATVSITLDKSKPVGTLYGGSGIVANNGYTNAAYVKFLASDRTAMAAYVKKPGTSGYVSYTLGTQFTAEGTYSFYAVDAASNRSDTYTVTLSRQIPQAQLYVDGEPLNNNSYTSGGHIKFECAESCFVMLPGTDAYVPYLFGAEYYKSGKYVFYGIDAANNHSGYYTVVIDRTAKPLTLHNVSDRLTDGDVIIDWTDEELTVVRRAPDILYALGAGEKNVVTFDRNYYLKDSVTVSIRDEYDEFAMFDVYAEDGSLLARLSLGESWILDSSGKYTVQAINHFGTSEVFTVIISLDAPNAVLTENADDKQLDIEIAESADKHSNLQTLEIYKSVDGDECWTLLIKDDYGNAISLDSLSYAFRTSGLYRVVLTDEFRTGLDAVIAQFDYKQKAPEGVLAGVENGGYTNGTVAFEWTDDAVVTLDRDGEEIEYISGQRLTENGSYTLTFENYDGYKKVYTFVIDNFDDMPGFEKVTLNGEDKRLNYGTLELTADGTYEVGVVADGMTYSFTVTVDCTAPMLTLSGVGNGGTTKDGVILSELSENAELRVFLNDTEISYTLGDTLTELGTYRVVLTDECRNQTEYSFEIVYSMNGGAIALIVIAIVVIMGGTVTVILMRKKGKFGNKKQGKK